MSISKQYFKSFDHIQQAQNAKSLSFFTTHKNGILSKEVFDEFSSILENDEERFRVSLHTNSEDDLHNMIIGMKKNSRVEPHKHEKSESYHVIKGKMLLVYFKDNGEVDKSVLMSPEDTLVARVDAGSFHGVVALSDVIYHETRIGPFRPQNDSVFATFSKERMAVFDAM